MASLNAWFDFKDLAKEFLAYFLIVF